MSFSMLTDYPNVNPLGQNKRVLTALAPWLRRDRGNDSSHNSSISIHQDSWESMIYRWWNNESRALLAGRVIQARLGSLGSHGWLHGRNGTKIETSPSSIWNCR